MDCHAAAGETACAFVKFNLSSQSSVSLYAGSEPDLTM